VAFVPEHVPGLTVPDEAHGTDRGNMSKTMSP
jgi:hypothetical protein